ncbi:hypothetical protein LOTGIDRAFT_162643 [Lottia gigantea]|uniref:Uncharacterized protein n=1 Tax=Lottia gigantea TaxID=225164 RepID=V3ZLX7_LOTGI|nr:hypothetical protein LOTGIDRAFT_162643 [Lottia gigantea]ESO92338.1 hypothetical protein LOTGIDRAFT_162643 [Lottia gigantea]
MAKNTITPLFSQVRSLSPQRTLRVQTSPPREFTVESSIGNRYFEPERRLSSVLHKWNHTPKQKTRYIGPPSRVLGPAQPCDKCGCCFCCLCKSKDSVMKLLNKQYWSAPEFCLNVSIGFQKGKYMTRF